MPASAAGHGSARLKARVSPQIARQPACRRQIPIDRTGRTAAPNPPAVSSPEASPTPAARANGNNLQQRVSENPSQQRKSVTATRTSAFGGKAEVDFGRLEVCL